MNRAPSKAQSQARMRNWHIRSIRALYAQAALLSPGRRQAVRSIIDDELQFLGAERTDTRNSRLNKEI